MRSVRKSFPRTFFLPLQSSTIKQNIRNKKKAKTTDRCGCNRKKNYNQLQKIKRQLASVAYKSSFFRFELTGKGVNYPANRKTKHILLLPSYLALLFGYHPTREDCPEEKNKLRIAMLTVRLIMVVRSSCRLDVDSIYQGLLVSGSREEGTRGALGLGGFQANILCMCTYSHIFFIFFFFSSAYVFPLCTPLRHLLWGMCIGHVLSMRAAEQVLVFCKDAKTYKVCGRNKNSRLKLIGPAELSAAV